MFQTIFIIPLLTLPPCRPYYLLIQARKSFRELLVTAIVDTPPEQQDVLVRRGPGFVIQRMGEPGV